MFLFSRVIHALFFVSFPLCASHELRTHLELLFFSLSLSLSLLIRRAGIQPSQPETPSGMLDELTGSICIDLTYEQRLYGFACCAGMGLICSFLSSLLWMQPMKFALLYSIGNILSLGSTGFLTGFARQAKNMFKATRLVATVMYLGCLIMTIVSACVLKSFPLTMMFLVLQSMALVWYCLSYIPGGRSVLKSCFGISNF